MRVFVSSVVCDYEHFRAAAKRAIDALGHVAVVMDRTHPASRRSPQTACLEAVEESDAVVLLIGGRYGSIQESGKSATHEEWDHARSLGKPLLVFVEDLDCRGEQQSAFLEEVSNWQRGRFWVHYTTPLELSPEVVGALRSLEAELDDGSDQDPAQRLPPNCRERIESLRGVSPVSANRVVNLLSDRASRRPGVLRNVAQDPPSWLQEADALAWEAISGFMDAHNLAGSDLARQRAIEGGSPRSSLYIVGQALDAAEKGDREEADALLARVPADYPLLEAIRARIGGDTSAVVEAVEQSGLHNSEDPDLALESVMMLVWAHWETERFDRATEVLRHANQRFRDRGSLLLLQANSTAGMVDQSGLESTGSHDLLNEVVRLSLRSRDCLRRWDGPSYRAVALATRVLLPLEEFHRVVQFASGPPDGEATDAEVGAPAVQRNLAYAYLMLGRFSDFDALRFKGINLSEETLLGAMRADRLGDPAALSKTRRALERAEDEPSRLRALLWLAKLGEVDEEALLEVPEAEVALFRGVAALNRGDLERAIGLLIPYRLESPIHAQYLAQAQHQTGQQDQAIETLTDAAQHLGALSLYESAAEMMFEQDKLIEAESVAKDVLSQGPPRVAEHRMRALLVRIAQRLKDWQTTESYARTLVREFPEDVGGAWMVVYALHCQGRNPEAWQYLVEHSLTPTDEQTARLAIVVYGAVDAPMQNAEPLLEIARMYTESEEVVGSVIVTLMAGGDRIRLSEEQVTQLHELTEDFVARYPQSQIFRAYSAAKPEELLEIMVDSLRAGAEELSVLINKVRYGHLPYGTLLWARPDLSYTDVLLSIATGWLTAVPTGEDQRARERRAAKQALDGKVAVDTSVVALGVRSGLDLNRFAAEFKNVLVPDELIIDARWAVSLAKAPATAVLQDDPVLARPTMTAIDKDQQQSRLERAETALEILGGWQKIISGRRPPTAQLEDYHRPWDASLRVAASEDGCALWCDDVALRVLAKAEGIPTFGTWALYEALSATPEGTWLPTAPEMMMRLLRAQIADIPISVPALANEIDESDGPDVAVGLFLARPHVWRENLAEPFHWYLQRLRTLIQGPNLQRVLGLLTAACHGLGAAVKTPYRQTAMGAILTAAIAAVGDPQIVPALVAASRYAANELQPLAQLDPLPGAVKHILSSLEPVIGPGPAAQILSSLFSETEPADRHTVTSIILEDR